MIDLHCHSVFSDGTKTPEEIIRLAEAKRLRAVALTDHDTVAGLPDFMSVKTNIERIAGTEISVEFSPGTMHMVGLFIDYKNSFLCGRLDELIEARKMRNESMLLAAGGLVGRKLTEIDVSSSNKGELGRPHIAKFLIKEGVVSDMNEAFDKYLGKGKPLYRDKRRFSFEESVEMIHSAGGIAVLAHPASLKLEREEYKPFVKSLIEKGLDALEVYCSYHDDADTEFFGGLAKELDVPISAGSDFHGDNKVGVSLGRWKGGLQNPENILYLLKKKAEAYK
jgi:predicted metal-dependent phosphoesterase TrpH